ncbi:uncharacterized protein LOC120353578 [Nilaparvata lugens]|uniref:uncharacterized protein LOC120353578 n=1 Tax=Nilaparvata lugens TaxID=108931 RepID=UPI00193E7362|nr:uncharacterized protein LOC120353578 [Nilaparvata lugens]
MFDIETLISQIKAHPIIYDTEHQDYSNNDLKAQCWYAIGNTLFNDWEAVNDDEKFERVEDMLMKWNEMKNAFVKDYKLQLMSSDQSKRKKPSLEENDNSSPTFEQMMFLLPFIKHPTPQQEIESSDTIEAVDTIEDVAVPNTCGTNNVLVPSPKDDSKHSLETSTMTKNVVDSEFINGSNVLSMPSKNAFSICENLNDSNPPSTPSFRNAVDVNNESSLLPTLKPAKPIVARKALVITRKNVLSHSKQFYSRINIEKKKEDLMISTEKTDINIQKVTKSFEMKKENENRDQYGHGTFLSSFAPILYSMPLQEAMQVRSKISGIMSHQFKNN